MLSQKYKQAIQVNKLSKSDMTQTLKISHVKLTTQHIIFTVTWITTTFTASRLPDSTGWENSDTCKLCLNKSTTVYLISICRPSILLISQLGDKQPSLFKRGTRCLIVVFFCCCFFISLYPCSFPCHQRDVVPLCCRIHYEGIVAEWSVRRTSNPAVPCSSPTLVACWICSRSFRVHILGHVCK